LPGLGEFVSSKSLSLAFKEMIVVVLLPEIKRATNGVKSRDVDAYRVAFDRAFGTLYYAGFCLEICKLLGMKPRWVPLEDVIAKYWSFTDLQSEKLFVKIAHELTLADGNVD